MSRIEWLKWVIFERPGPSTSRAKQLRLFFIFELYSLLCKLRGYPVPHFLESRSLPAGQYILVRPRLPFSIRLLDRIFPFGKWEHVEYVPYTAKVAEEMREAGKRIEFIEISYQLKVESR
jgi:hypothetical protein